MYIVRNCAKRSLSAVFAALCIFTAVSCSKKTEKADSRTIKITATFYPLYIMCLNLTANVPDVELTMLAPPETGCLHDYTLTTKDMQAITSCSILVANGAGMESFLDKALSLKKDAVITAAEGYSLIDGNPHVWVAPAGALYEVRRIADGLVKLDPAHAQQYAANEASYCRKLSDLSAEMHTMLDPYAGSSIITFHEAFPYFASEFSLNLASVIEREPGTAPSAKELSELIRQIKSVQKTGRAVSLYAEPQYSSSSADVIASETGLTVYELDPCVTGPLSADAYINAQEKNMLVLAQSLSAHGEK